MDPDEWLAHHRAYHDRRQRARAVLLYLCFVGFFFVVGTMVYIAFRTAA